VIELEHIDVDLGTRRVLSGITVRLAAHRTAVIGSNGSGKSTFARLINGLVTPVAGSVRVHGLDPQRDRRRVRRLVGFVFTDPDAQIVMPTVAEDVAFSLRGRGLSRAEVDERVAAVLGEHGLGEHADQPAHDLSGGQKQRLALCSVLVTKPGVLVADEPTTLLDAAGTRQIRRLLAGLPMQQVIVTHDLGLAADCDEAILFDGGRLVRQGAPEAVIAEYESLLC